MLKYIHTKLTSSYDYSMVHLVLFDIIHQLYKYMYQQIYQENILSILIIIIFINYI